MIIDIAQSLLDQASVVRCVFQLALQAWELPAPALLPGGSAEGASGDNVRAKLGPCMPRLLNPLDQSCLPLQVHNVHELEQANKYIDDIDCADCAY